MAQAFQTSLQLRAQAQLLLRSRQAEIRPALPDYLTWTQQHRRFLAPAKPFDLTQHHYLREIYRDNARELVIQKAAQIGASEYLIGFVLWSADTRNANALYVFPTDGDVSDFSAARLGPAIAPEVSSYLADLVVGSSERGADRVTLKRVRNRFIYFRGGKIGTDGQAHQLKSIDADVLVLDEFDELDPRVEPIARKRLEHSALAQVRIVSTPTFDGVGIHAAYTASDQRVWMLRCGACGERQEIGLSNLVLEWDELERPLKWNGGDAPFLACGKCGQPLDRTGDGEWVAKYPEREVHGYHVLRWFAGTKSLPSILTDLREIDETKRQQTFNQGLGLTYRSKTSSRLNRAVLDGCRREYALGGVASAGAYAGIDVGTLLHIVVRDGGPERRALYIGAVKSFDEAREILARFPLRVCVIDALPESRKAREFQQGVKRGKVWVALYQEGEGAVAAKESPARWDGHEFTVHIDRTRSLDATYALFYAASEKEPGNTLPANARNLADYYDQLCAPIRKLVDGRDGNQRAVYVEGAEADHYAHAENYCAVARLCPYVGWTRGAGN